MPSLSSRTRSRWTSLTTPSTSCGPSSLESTCPTRRSMWKRWRASSSLGAPWSLLPGASAKRPPNLLPKSATPSTSSTVSGPTPTSSPSRSMLASWRVLGFWTTWLRTTGPRRPFRAGAIPSGWVSGTLGLSSPSRGPGGRRCEMASRSSACTALSLMGSCATACLRPRRRWLRGHILYEHLHSIPNRHFVRQAARGPATIR
mmetsp:Transcript_19582/g.52827  ORF Transcript_19582/g.52827 Transcript_19582/m.52827 type:complete len:202 (-) Transcript_19582:365-970(-)